MISCTVPGPPLVAGLHEEVVISFGALFQGDHLGVEVACDSHANLLESFGLLPWESRLSSSSHIYDDRITSGLVIDDFFVLSKEPQSFVPGSGASKSEEIFQKAKKIYKQQRLLGSDDKDVVGQRCFKVCGGEVDASERAVASGVVALGAPYGKRMALSLLTAGVASLPYTDDALHSTLVGSWISTLLLRRPAMSLLDEVFKVIPPAELTPEKPKLRPLHRGAAVELQVLAVLSPILVSNLAVPFSQKLYATDASLAKGGIVEADITEEMSALLWRSASRKGPNVPVLRSGQAMLNLYDTMFEELPAEESFEEDVGIFGEVKPQRPIGMRFQFIEVCGGSGVVTKELIKLGIICGPVLDLSISKQYDVKNRQVLMWVAFLLEEDRLDSFLVAPPCTTFSAAAHPCCRSYQETTGLFAVVREGTPRQFPCLCSSLPYHGGFEDEEVWTVGTAKEEQNAKAFGVAEVAPSWGSRELAGFVRVREPSPKGIHPAGGAHAGSFATQEMQQESFSYTHCWQVHKAIGSVHSRPCTGLCPFLSGSLGCLVQCLKKALCECRGPRRHAHQRVVLFFALEGFSLVEVEESFAHQCLGVGISAEVAEDCCCRRRR